jgi:hypothetical protein
MVSAKRQEAMILGTSNPNANGHHKLAVIEKELTLTP